MGQRSGKLFYLLPLLFSIGIEAGEIKGVVTDSATKESVGGAIVNARSSNLPAGANALTEENGGYSLPGLPAGTYTVTADYAGAKATKTITLGADDVVTLNLAVSLAQAVGETYTVTGTRLPSLAAASVSPVSTLTSEAIRQQGSTRIEDAVNSSPQTFVSQNSSVGNGSNGTADANLRGLGASRTLVLIDGRRLGPGNPNSFGPVVGDLNFIPAQLVERVDILTGGASAVYGADAVSGVVNFVMKKNFEGVQLNFDWSFFQHVQQEKAIQALIADAAATSPRFYSIPQDIWNPMGPAIALTLGVNSPDGKGNVTAYATWRKDSAVLQGDYDYAGSPLLSGTTTFFPGVTGSDTTYPAAFFRLDNGDFFSTSGHTFVDGDKPYNYNPLNPYQRPDERYNFGALAHYELAPWADVYMQAMFLDDRTIAQVAPSGLFFEQYNLNCDNPFLDPSQYTRLGCTAPTDTVSPLIGRRNVEGGGRQSVFDHSSYRVVAGVRGDLGSAWKYDAYMQYMATNIANYQNNYFNKEKIQKALIARDDGSGNTVCQSVLDGTDPNCVPYNIFLEGADVSGALKYLQDPGLEIDYGAERVVDASLVGDLGAYGLTVPFAKQGVSLGVGGEYRHQSITVTPDYLTSNALLSGSPFAVSPADAAMDVWELFGETRVPLIQNVVGIKDLSLEGAYRFSHYSFNKDTHTFKAGGVWEFMNNMRFRGSFQRAVRAPALNELFLPQTVGLDGGSDPCAGLSVGDPMLATCANIAWGPDGTTYSQAQFVNNIENPASQYYGLLGGNPDLKPEAADTFAVGLYAEPDFVPGLSFSVDYFNISVKDVIGGIGADLILKKCVEGDAEMCKLVHRDANGSLWTSKDGYVIDTNFNLGGLKTDGIDFMLNYMLDFRRLDFEKGNVVLNFVGTWMNSLSTQPLAGDEFYNCSGYYGLNCGTPNPAWRHKLRATWNTCLDLSLSAQWRYIAGVDVDALSSDPQLNSPANQRLTDLRLGDRSYLDLYASYSLLDMFTFAAGVNNVIDTDPPVTGNKECTTRNSCNGNTWPQTYDAAGRYFFLSGTAKF